MNQQYIFQQHPGIKCTASTGQSYEPDLSHPTKQVPACIAAGVSSQEWSSWVATGLSAQFCRLKKSFYVASEYRDTYRWTCPSSNTYNSIHFNSTSSTASLLSAKPGLGFEKEKDMLLPLCRLTTYWERQTYQHINKLSLSAWLVSIVEDICVITFFWSGAQ